MYDTPLRGLADEIASGYASLAALHRAVAAARGYDTEGTAHEVQASILEQDHAAWSQRMQFPQRLIQPDLPDPRSGYST